MCDLEFLEMDEIGLREWVGIDMNLGCCNMALTI